MKNLCVFLVAFFLTGCYYKGIYKISLQNVEVSNDILQGNQKIVPVIVGENEYYSFEDSLINITWIPGVKQFEFLLINKTDKTMRIIWDDAVYIDENATSKRLSHSNVKLTDINNSQVPSIIARNSKLEDFVIPISNISFKGYWHFEPFFLYETIDPENLQHIKDAYVGSVVSILLPINIDNTTIEYIFSFKIDDFIYKEPKTSGKRKPKAKYIDPIYQ